jgi:hypothetical protein
MLIKHSMCGISESAVHAQKVQIMLGKRRSARLALQSFLVKVKNIVLIPMPNPGGQARPAIVGKDILSLFEGAMKCRRVCT